MSSMGICSLCKSKCVDVWVTDPCRHEACSKCLVSRDNLASCFECSNEIGFVSCPGSEHGCTFNTSQGPWKEHQVNCMRLPVECPYKCQAIVEKRTLLSHMAADCQLRLATCQFCQDTVFHVELDYHEETCPEGPISCPYCQKENIKRGSLPEHAENCSETPKSCPLKEYGCTFLGLDIVMGEHLSVRNHVSCFLMLKKGLEQRDAEIASLCSQLSACKSDLDTLKNDMQEKSQKRDDEMSNLDDKLTGCKNDLDTLKNEIKDEAPDGAQLFDEKITWAFVTPDVANYVHTSPVYRQRSTKTSFCFTFTVSSTNTLTLNQHLLEAGTPAAGKTFAVTVTDRTKNVVAEKKGLTCADQQVLNWTATQSTFYAVTCVQK
uniref:Putative tumor necrosis factor-mediated signaling pathway n=1 Tax=Ornithodoros turicata TaxID=34597 RepID=A0A2R5L9P6_9ACAR